MSKRSENIDLDNLWSRILGHVGKSFPGDKLKNRLLNLGLEEFLGKDGKAEWSLVLKYGFPFKFNNQLDEGILVLANFLDRFKREGGRLEIYAINKISKADEKDLSFWLGTKAKLYLELQNMILLLNGTEFHDLEENKKRGKPKIRQSRIRRIFAFRKLSDLAFLSQAGVNVIGEQLAADIEIGFMFVNKFLQMKHITSSLIVNFKPQIASDGDRGHNFYVLYGLPNGSSMYNLPYEENCSAKWFTQKERDAALRNDPRLKEMLGLFTNNVNSFDKKKEWSKLGLGNSANVCRFEQSSRKTDEEPIEFFNEALLMMFDSYKGSKTSEDIGNNEFIINRINRAVITRDMIRLQRAMTAFTDAIEIRAVDATSTKNSLSVHEGSPVYRDWLRRSLNRVLKSDNKTLHRIYILKDDKEEEDIETEYQTLMRLMQFYLDHFHYEVSEMAKIVDRDAQEPRPPAFHNAANREWFESQWRAFAGRTSVYVTTSTVIKKFVEKILPSDYEVILEQIFRGRFGKSKKVYGLHDVAKLDYLYARYDDAEQLSGPEESERTPQNMIYNFLNPRADTSELSFPAFTYRDTVSISEERKSLVTKLHDRGLGPSLEETQDQIRVNLIAISLLEYWITYRDILVWDNEKEEDKKCQALLETIRNEASKDILVWAVKEEDETNYEKLLEIITNQTAGNVNIGLLVQMLRTRAVVEKKLYEYFKPHFDYLNAVLEFLSAKVDFSKPLNASSIRELSPFLECETKDKKGNSENRVTTFTQKLTSDVRDRLKNYPEEVPRLKDYLPSASEEYPNDVFISYKNVSPIKEWVRKLYACLKATGLRVVLDVERGFGVGEGITPETERAVKESAHTLGIISPRYFKGHSGEEADIAHRLGLSGKKKSFIPMIVEKMEMDEWDAWASALVSIDWTNPETHEQQWRNLLAELGVENKGYPHPGSP